jgi:RNA-dependent RNA polymerase
MSCIVTQCLNHCVPGLDVKVCDRVIRLGGAPSLIQVIQSKGRARDKAGKLDLICTVEEEEHFNKLLEEEAMLDSVLRSGSDFRSGEGDADYLEEFMQKCSVRGKRDDADADCSDTESMTSLDSDTSSDSDSFDKQQVDEEGTSAEDIDEGDRERARSYGLQLLLCSEHADLDEMVQNTLQLQSHFIECITRLRLTLRGANSAVSDPRMFQSSDSLAHVSVTSKLSSFNQTFCSAWDFKVNGSPVYLLAYPALPAKQIEVEGRNATTTDFSPNLLGSVETSESVSSLSGALGVSCGHFVGRQCFLQMGVLGSTGRLRYSRVHVERGKRNTLIIEGVLGGDGGDRVLICIPATILSRNAIVSADRSEKTLTIAFTVTSTPSVFFQPGGSSDKDSDSCGSLYESMRSGCRVFCRNTTTTTASSPDPEEHLGASSPDAEDASTKELARNDLQLLASCPVVAVAFNLKKWRSVMKLFTDPTALGLSVLITRVDFNKYTGDSSFQQLSLHAADLSGCMLQLAKKCQWTFATLVSDVYCTALNPVVLLKIKEYVVAALQSGLAVRIQAVTTAVQQLHWHLKQCLYWENAQAYFVSVLTSLNDMGVQRREGLGAASSSNNGENSEAFIVETEEFVMVPRVLATPSRLLVMSAVHTKSNRLIRMLGGKYTLVYVKFRDEQGQGLFSEQIYSERYKQMLIDGLSICGPQFHFLLSSSSQLREQTAVFFDGTLEERAQIRSSLVPNKAQFNGDLAKYISRMGLFCTADTDTGQVLSEANTIVEEDILTRAGKVLTDGAGRITSEFSHRIFQSFFDSKGYYPTCVQIRAMGCKGVLLVDPRLELDHPGKDVVFRKSMRKFDTEGHTTLCIVKVAEFHPVKLNREVINLLCAIRDHTSASGCKNWSPHNTLVALQDEELNRLGQMLVDPRKAIDSLCEHYPRKVLLSLVQSGMNILYEPHFMSLLHLQYYHATRALRKKTHIPVLHGTLAMGAPDPTGVLRDGEISIIIHRPVHHHAGRFDEQNEYQIGDVKLIRLEPQSSDDTSWAAGFETFAVTGPVAFYRNPCLDPGDLRVVTAVLRPELLHWKNEVLLPASSEHCVRSLSAECSGGDLDGDTFGIIWDHRLVPPKERSFEAVDYEQLARKAKKQRSSEVPSNDEGSSESCGIADFVARTMCNSNLGRIANLHLALCDQLTETGQGGAGHPLARQLAEAQSLAVDYPKTGVPPVIPSAARKQVRWTGYPHFMENQRKLSYPSYQSLGTLYNITSSVACTVAFAGNDREFHADVSIAVPDWEDFRAEAEESYKLFEGEVKGVMLRYGLESDAEMVLGVPYKWSDEFELDHAAAAESLAASWSALRSRFKKLFYSTLLEDSSEAKLKKACAWYHASYTDKPRFHSFAWIVYEELALVKVASSAALLDFEAHRLVSGSSWAVHDSVSISVGHGAWSCWEAQKTRLVHALHIKEQLVGKIKNAILSCQAMKLVPPSKSAGPRIHPYGSFALMLCDYQSDIDLCVNIPNLPAETVLKDIVIPGVSTVAEFCAFVPGKTVPLVRMAIEDGYMGGTPVDVSACMGGVYKSWLILYLYSMNPAYLLLFSSVVQWGRCCGLLRGFAAEKRRALLNSGQMQALIVHFILHYTPAPSHDLLESTSAVITKATILNAVKNTESYKLELGKLLLSFFITFSEGGCGACRLGTAEANTAESQGRSFQFTWPVPGAPEHSIESSSMQEIGRCCRRALQCLAVSGSWSYLLEYCIAFERARTVLELELSVSLSKIIAPTRAYLAMWLRFRSKADTVHIIESPADPSRLVVHATGRYQQILVMRQELLTLIYTGRLHSYGAIRSMASAYFMEGSSFLYAAGTDSKACRLQARPMYVDRYLMRCAYCMKAISTISTNAAFNSSSGDVWKTAFKTEFCAKVTEQLSHLSKVKNGERVMFSVHLGKMLLLDAARTFERSHGSISVSEMETAMNSAKNRKISTYGVEVQREGSTGDSAKPSVKPQQKKEKGTNRSVGGNNLSAAGTNKKSNLTSTFVSAIPIFEFKDASVTDAERMGPSDLQQQALTAFSEYTRRINGITGKLETILSGLGYGEYKGASGQGQINIPGTTLTLPPTGWRVAVELNERQQLHVDLDEQGHIAAVSDRFLSWVNGTLVTPAEIDLGCVLEEDCEDVAESKSIISQLTMLKYDFKNHDLRFKIGTVKIIGEASDLHELACPGGAPPIELVPLEQSAVVNEKDEEQPNQNSGVDSQLSSEYLRTIENEAQPFTYIRPAPQLKRPGMVSFARHVTQRKAFLFSPPTQKVKLMAVMAVGDCYEGATLRVVNPFVDISLEVDASGLISCLDGQVMCDADGAGEHIADPLALSDHLDDICDEILRVSDRIREAW